MPRSYLDLTEQEAGFFSAFVVCNDRVNTIWLEGVIDLAIEQSLDGLVLMLRHDPRSVTIDLSRITFCDCRLVNFIADLQHDHPTCLRDAPLIAVELIRLAGLRTPPPQPTRERPAAPAPQIDLTSLRSSIAAEEVMV